MMIRAFKIFIPTSIFNLFLIEAAIVCGCFIAAPYLDSDTLPRDFVPVWIMNEGLFSIAIAALTILVGLYFMNFYSGGQRWGRLIVTQRVSFVLGISLLVQAFLSIVRPDWMLPRRMMLTGSALTLIGLIGSRLLFHNAVVNSEMKRRMLFLGMSPVVVQIASHLEEHPEFGLVPAAYLDPVDWGNPGGMQWLGPVERWVQMVEELQPEWIVIGDRGKISPEWTEELVELGFGGVRVEEASTLYETTFSRFCISDWHSSEVLFSDFFQYRQVSINLQTLVSVASGVICGIVALPVIAFAWLVLKVTQQGEVLVSEDRLGLGGELIRLHRFQGRKETTGVWRLQALPMLWNLAKGDISLIGPEAHSPAFAEQLSEAFPLYGLRHLVKPGILGWAQINTSAQAAASYNAQTALEYDLYYVKYFSPSLDVYIVLKALRNMISRPE